VLEPRRERESGDWLVFVGAAVFGFVAADHGPQVRVAVIIIGAVAAAMWLVWMVVARRRARRLL
jgi:Flp pilus assembly protein TadB